MADQKFTNADLAACAKREAGLRRRAYPRWVENRTLTQGKADREIAMMEEIQARLEILAKADREHVAPKLI